MRAALGAALVLLIAVQTPSVAIASVSGGGTPSAVVGTPKQAAGVSELSPVQEIAELRQELQIVADNRKTGQEDAQYFFNAVLIIIGAATLIIALFAIGATILGYRMVRRYVQSEFTRRADEAFDQHGRPLLEDAVRATGERVDHKLWEIDARLAEELNVLHAAGKDA